MAAVFKKEIKFYREKMFKGGDLNHQKVDSVIAQAITVSKEVPN
jgi:hypothetical protein